MNPNSPKMIDGIPARQSVPNLSARVNPVSRVYSVR
jgi:hypothetical protein